MGVLLRKGVTAKAVPLFCERARRGAPPTRCEHRGPTDGDLCSTETAARSRRKSTRSPVGTRSRSMSSPTLRSGRLRTPLIELVVVRGGFDMADDWIVEHIGTGDIAIDVRHPAGRAPSLEGGAVPRAQGSRLHRGIDRRRDGDSCPPRHAEAIGRFSGWPRSLHKG